MANRVLITGATGFVGSHVAEACAARGDALVAIVRPATEAAMLQKLGARVVRGELTDPAVVADAASDIDVIVHCAAKVGDWGPVEDYRAVNVAGTRTLLDAVRGKPLKRFVHLSSLGVYEARHHHGTDETVPLPARHMDGYTQTKIESEALVRDEFARHQTPIVVLRPGFIYGPRDRTLLPAIVERLKKKQVSYISGGKAALNTTYVGNLVDAILMAIERPEAVGEVFNITDGEFVSKRQFFEAIADGLGLERPDGSFPLWAAKGLATVLESFARLTGARKAPFLTGARIKFIGLNLDFSIEKAKRLLGYAPKTRFADAIKTTLDWYQHQTGV